MNKCKQNTHIVEPSTTQFGGYKEPFYSLYHCYIGTFLQAANNTTVIQYAHNVHVYINREAHNLSMSRVLVHCRMRGFL